MATKRIPLAIARWDGTSLRAASTQSREAIADLPAGTILEIYDYRPRTNQQMKYAHALMKRAAQNSPDNWTEEGLKVAVKYRCGLVHGVLRKANGDEKTLLRSLAELDRKEMSDFIEELIFYITTNVCPGMDVEALKKEAKKDIAAIKPDDEPEYV